MTDQTNEKYASNALGDNHLCQKPWPKDCHVQCGDRGIVFSKTKAPRTTAFFEAFPDTFIRGEGSTVAEAEEKAWEKYQRQVNCQDHDFERHGNSEHGSCKHCGLFKTDIFKPTHSCAICGKPEINFEYFGHYICLEHYLAAAENPEAISQQLEDKEGRKPSILETLFSKNDDDDESKLFYHHSAWLYETLREYDIIPDGLEDYEAHRYLFSKKLDFDPMYLTHRFFHAFYDKWHKINPDLKVNAFSLMGIEDKVLNEKSKYQAAVLTVLYRLEMIDHFPSEFKETFEQVRRETDQYLHLSVKEREEMLANPKAHEDTEKEDNSDTD